MKLYLFLQKQSQITSKERMFLALFPGESYKDEKIRLCMSHLVKKIEAFLVYQYQQTQIGHNAKNLAKIYRHKKLYKASERVLNIIENQQEQQTFRNGDYFLSKYELALDRFDHSTTVRTTEQNLQEVSDYLDTAFIILKLQQACSSISHQAVYQQDYQLGLLNLILPYVQTQQLMKIPAIGIYYYCYLALIDQNATENFEKFKQLLFDYNALFPVKEWRNLFLFGTNICIKIINKGDQSYLKEILELYKKGLETEALFDDGVLTRFTYQNIVTAGMRTNELEWTEQFLINYKDRVEKPYRESAFRFNMARLAYHQKEYEQAMDLLRDTDQKDMLINLYSKNLLLKIYYELEKYKLLDSFLDAFQIYLRRKKVIPLHKENYQKMIYYTQKLMRLNPYKKSAQAALKERIEQESFLMEKEWLLTQLAKFAS